MEYWSIVSPKLGQAKGDFFPTMDSLSFPNPLSPTFLQILLNTHTHTHTADTLINNISSNFSMTVAYTCLLSSVMLVNDGTSSDLPRVRFEELV